MASDLAGAGASYFEVMRGAVLDSVRRSLAGATRVAFVGFPDHGNVGDSAIWLGTKAALDYLGVEVGYVATWWSYDRARLSDAVGDGPVVLHGGGNLGDRYTVEQHLRERVLRDFRDRPVIQLPQTVHFDDARRARAFGRLAVRHPALTVLVRDSASSEALARLGVPCELAPDMVFAMEMPPRPSNAAEHGSLDVVWVARTDCERHFRADGFASRAGVLMTDWEQLVGGPDEWPDDVRMAWSTILDRQLRTMSESGIARRALRGAARRTGQFEARPWIGRSGRGLGDLAVLATALDRMATYRVELGLGLLGSAGVVVTDRLHAYLFALLLGVPAVVYDNTDHKVRRFWEAWPPPPALAQWASDPEDAWGRSRALSAG